VSEVGRGHAVRVRSRSRDNTGGGVPRPRRVGAVRGVLEERPVEVRRPSQCVVKDAVGPHGDQRVVSVQWDEDRSAALDGLLETVVEELPKNVNNELYGGERPMFVVSVRNEEVWCSGVHTTGVVNGSPVRGRWPGVR
jgi:hypothetical protein